MTVTISYFLIGFALVDLVLGLASLRRAGAAGLDEDRRRSLRYIGGAMIASAILLVLVALFVPIGRLRHL